MSTADLVWAAIGFVLSVMVFSYLLGDNALFRLAIHLFIGAASGYAAVILATQVVYPRLILPLLSKPITTGDLILDIVIPMLLSLMLLLVLWQRFSPAGRVPLALLLGAAAAFAISGAARGTLLPQAQATIQLFKPAGLPAALPEAILTTLGVVTVLAYYYHGVKVAPDGSLKRPRWVRIGAVIGGAIIFITLGALYAGVLTTAISALVERLYAFWTLVSALVR
jgi:predicted membrane protein